MLSRTIGLAGSHRVWPVVVRSSVDPKLGFELRPNSSVASEVDYRINSDGFRGPGLPAPLDFATAGDVHANGCHACEVLVNPDDGTLRVERHVIVADVGRAINPLIVHGQMHGGAAQGIGQALMEHVRFEADTGQPLTGSFMEYVLPRADDLPAMTVELNELPEADNPLGVKGAGENATTGAPAAVMNAVRDALRSSGDADVDMPAMPERIWRALRRAKPGIE